MIKKGKNLKNVFLVIFIFMIIVIFSFSICNGNGYDQTEVVSSNPAKVITDVEEVEYTTSNLAVPSVNGKLHVEGTMIVDEKNQPVQLRGLSTHGIAWFPQYINDELFAELKEQFHINVIRLAMYTEEYGGYCSGGDKEELKELVKKGVELAKENDMYVIIDWHILSDKDPNIHKNEAISFFDEMSDEFSDYNNVIYEICNEPNGGTSWNDIKSYADEVIGVIRENDDDAIVIVGTPTWSQEVDKVVNDPITGYENVMYALHFYAGTHKDDLRNRTQNVIDSGLPIFVSEFGICDASGSGDINAEEAEKWIKLLNDNNVSYVAWNISNKDETSAVFKPNVTKVSGFSTDDLSESGSWLYNMFNQVYLLDNGSFGFVETEEDDKLENENNVANKNSEIEYEQFGNESDDFIISSYMTNNWESNGEQFYKYEISIENNSDEFIDSWEVDIPFNGNITLKDHWNGEYSVIGNNLHIKSKEYNGKIEPHGSVREIGFIVSGSTIIE